MPETWPAIARKEHYCVYEDCEHGNKIVPNEDCVQARVKGNVVVTWHPQCWVVDAFAALRRNPKADVKPGRRALDLSPEEKMERERLQRAYAALKQRAGHHEETLLYIDSNSARAKALHIRIQLLELKQDAVWYEIQQYGGAPSTWRVPEAAKGKMDTKETTVDD